MPVYLRVFSSAAIGLAGAAASIMFRSLSPVPQEGQAAGWLTYPGSHGWLDRPHQAALAVACAVAFGVLLADHGHDLFELLAAADLALYRAKHSGRDRVCLHDPAHAAPDTRH